MLYSTSARTPGPSRPTDCFKMLMQLHREDLTCPDVQWFVGLDFSEGFSLFSIAFRIKFSFFSSLETWGSGSAIRAGIKY